MNYPASALILLMLAVTFLTSAHDKIFHWKDNVAWLNGHFKKTLLQNIVPFSLAIIAILELLAAICSLVGICEIYYSGGRTFGFYGAVFSCVTLIFLLLGQRLAKDYDGARTLILYFIPAVLAVYWLS